MKKVMLFLGVMVFVVSGLLAQDVKPAKYENVTWHRVVMVDYKPGKVGRAKEIITIYKSAAEEAGLKSPQTYWFTTGEWDQINIWTMDGGPSDMEWDISPDGIKWRAAMVKKVGSEEALKKLQEEFQSLRQSTTSYIARKEL